MYLLFDIGGTVTRAAFSRDGIAFSSPRLVPTPQNFDVGMKTLASLGRDVSGGGRIAAVCAGVPSTFSKNKQELFKAPHLPLWSGKSLSNELKKMFDARILVENDAALCGLGEAVAGAGKGKSIVAYLTVSTGVGGARIVDRKIDRNRYGFEPGHQVIDLSGKGCETCTVAETGREGIGHLESYVSGTALQARFSMPPEKIVNPAVWEESARFLAHGIYNTILHWSPDMVVLGGSMIVKPVGIKVAKVAEHLKGLMHIFPEIPELRQAELGDMAGLHGALALIRSTKE